MKGSYAYNPALRKLRESAIMQVTNKSASIVGLLIMIYGELPGVRYFGYVRPVQAPILFTYEYRMFLAVFGAQSNV